MMRRKKKDPNAPPPPPRDNGLPPKPADFDAAVKAVAEHLPEVNVAGGYGFSGLQRVGAWRVYVFTDNAELVIPTESNGYPVERRPAYRPSKPNVWRSV